MLKINENTKPLKNNSKHYQLAFKSWNLHSLPLVIFILLMIFLFPSCSKKLTYLQNLTEIEADTLIQNDFSQYKLQPADILYIQIITADKEINALFNSNLTEVTSGTGLSEEMIYYKGYTLNDSGYIELPILKEIHLFDLTIEEAKNKILLKAEEYLKNPQVIIKLANFRYTLLGEVKYPGIIVVQDQKLNIMEALAYGGDITYNGNRKNILIMRSTIEGTKSYRVDVTNKSIINSPQYYIQPNDVIYVEPLGTTLFRERSTDYVFFISAVTSTLSAIVLILNLANK